MAYKFGVKKSTGTIGSIYAKKKKEKLGKGVAFDSGGERKRNAEYC